ncbi:MAG: hypothetical protein HY729_01820 [Candidatus Rokubacteria bacterium]|nr:hypothetical protein [Candidatus Rokubacteria bacterium]
MAVVLSVALTGPSLTEGQLQPTQEFKGKPPEGLYNRLVLQRDFSCKAWFAKDSAGTPYPVPTLVTAWDKGSVWMFYSLTYTPPKGSKQPVKPVNVAVDATHYGASYVLNFGLPQNVLKLQNIVKFLNSGKYPTAKRSVASGTTKYPLGQIAFWPLWDGWQPGSNHYASVKWNFEARLLDSDKVCSAFITVQYQNLP